MFFGEKSYNDVQCYGSCSACEPLILCYLVWKAFISFKVPASRKVYLSAKPRAPLPSEGRPKQGAGA